MTESRISRVASAVIQELHDASPDHPSASKGNPSWYYELSSRVAALIGDAEIVFVSHTFTDSRMQDGAAWVFTDRLALLAKYVGDSSRGELSVEAIGRATLKSLTVDGISDAFDASEHWPQHIQVTLDYGYVSVTLPQERGSYNRQRLAAILPSLALDLNGRA